MAEIIYSKKILIVDDDTTIINMMKVALQKEQFQEIYTALNGHEAVKIAKVQRPDLVVLDIMLPDSDGYEVCKQIRTFSMAPIIFLSAKNEEIDRLLSFAVGGDEYLTKPFSPKELVARIRVALRRQVYYEREEPKETKFHFGDGFCLDLKTRTLKQYEQLVPLPHKEYEVLEYLVTHHDTIVTREMIMDDIWECDYRGYDNTVMVHISHLRDKIEVDPARPQLIKTVKGRGYYFESKD